MEYKDFKLVYRQYAALYIVVGVTDSEVSDTPGSHGNILKEEFHIFIFIYFENINPETIHLLQQIELKTAPAYGQS